MSERQEFMVESEHCKVYFVRRVFDTALAQAERYISRNRGKFEMKLFRQESAVGPRWVWMRDINV